MSLIQRMLHSEARTLTDRIKRGTEDLYRLLERIHDEKGYLSLGYKSWEAYLREEFEYSKNYANKLVAHAKFQRQIEAKAGTRVPGLAEGDTRGLDAEEVAEAIAERVGADPEQAKEIAKDEVRKAKEKKKAERKAKSDSSRAKKKMEESIPEGFDPEKNKQLMETWEKLCDAVDLIAELPDVDEMIRILPDYYSPRLVQLPHAAGWLHDFERAYKKRRFKVL